LAGALDERGIGIQAHRRRGSFSTPEDRYSLEDAIGRTWQLTTVQIGFNFPERFELEYHR